MLCTSPSVTSLLLGNADPRIPDLLLTLNLSGDTSTGPITEMSGTSVDSVLLYLIGPTGTIPPRFEEGVGMGTGSGSVTVDTASAQAEKEWELISIFGGSLTAGVLDYASADRTAFNAWANENSSLYSCLGAHPSTITKVRCEVVFDAEVLATGVKLVAATGVLIAQKVFKVFGSVMSEINLDKYAEQQVSQSNTLLHHSALTMLIRGLSPLVINPAAVPASPVSIPYAAPLNVSGGVAPYDWSVVSGTLPAGISLVPQTPAGYQTAVLQGVPNSPGTSTFTIAVTDSVGSTVTRSYTLTILAAGSNPQPPGVGSPPPPPPPPPSASISIGWGSNPATYGNWMDITFSNFPTGTVTWYCVEEGTAYGPYSTTLSSSTQTFTTNTCEDIQPGGSDYVTVGGATSNTIATDYSPPPPPPPSESISIGWGGTPAPAGNWMDITFTNFPTGTVSWYCVEEGTAYGPFSTTLSSSTETFTANTCYDTQSGGSDYVTAGGATSNTIATDYSPPPPPPPSESISIGWGGTPAPAGNWMDITFTNFPTGTVSWYCVEEGTAYGPFSTTLSSSTETFTANTCYDTQSGGSDYVTAGGATSNTIATDYSPPPPPPPSESISIGWGGTPAPAGNWMDITFTNFPTGTVSWYCVEEGTAYGPFSTTLSSSTETFTANTCYDTQSGGSDYVTAGGATSNTIATD